MGEWICYNLRDQRATADHEKYYGYVDWEGIKW